MTKDVIKVATANVHESRTLNDPDGLTPFVNEQVDVLLMQEVLGYEEFEIARRLEKDNFALVHCVGEMGLAIALNRESAIVLESLNETVLHQPGKVERFIKKLEPKSSNHLRRRGMIAVGLVTSDEQPLVVATTHPIVFVRSGARKKQVTKMGETLMTDSFYEQPRVIVGGDMNHYPGPRQVDIDAQASAGFSRVEPNEATWCIRGSRHEWMARIGSLLTRRELESFDAELDAILYKGVKPLDSSVIDIQSDHKAVVANFLL